MKLKQALWWTTFFVSALVASTMLTVLTATGVEAKMQNPALAQW
jgi:hypothetical protein